MLHVIDLCFRTKKAYSLLNNDVRGKPTTIQTNKNKAEKQNTFFLAFWIFTLLLFKTTGDVFVLENILFHS